ncbi:MAG: heavy-metal-associated domain-containing protein [Candidatus Nanopelagicales bacterium]
MPTTTTYAVIGMTCGHCVKAVTEELSALPGVSVVSVELVKGGVSKATVTSSEPLPDESVRAAIDEAGYELADATGVAAGRAPAPQAGATAGGTVLPLIGS